MNLEKMTMDDISYKVAKIRESIQKIYRVIGPKTYREYVGEIIDLLEECKILVDASPKVFDLEMSEKIKISIKNASRFASMHSTGMEDLHSTVERLKMRIFGEQHGDYFLDENLHLLIGDLQKSLDNFISNSNVLSAIFGILTRGHLIHENTHAILYQRIKQDFQILYLHFKKMGKTLVHMKTGTFDYYELKVDYISQIEAETTLVLESFKSGLGKNLN
jgi:hypothetical protein